MRIDFALRLPGFTLPIMKYWDGQGLRLVLLLLPCTALVLPLLFLQPASTKAKPCSFHFAPNPSFLSRKKHKRSHTLRYVLKNRKTGKVLLVVLFTLYLNEDVDEQGNIKPGVESGIPFHKMDKDKAARFESKRDEGAVDETSTKESFGEKKENEKFYEGDDDVD
jgi:hypothetical protein